MSYPDFVWFLLSEEDKKHPRRCDLLKRLYSTMTFTLIKTFLFLILLFLSLSFFPFKYWVLVPLYGCGRWWCPVDVRVGIFLHRAGIQDGCPRYRDNGVSRLPLSGMGINSLSHSILKSPPPHEKKTKKMPFTLTLSLHSYCAYVEKLFNNQIFLHPLSTTQQWKLVETWETWDIAALISLIFVFELPLQAPHLSPPNKPPPPPPPTFPHSRSQKASSPFGGITRRYVGEVR